MNRSTVGRRPLPRLWLLPLAIGLVVALPAQADSVTDWNTLATSPGVLPRFGGPQQQYRAMAIVQLAVHDALNSIQPRFQRYTSVSAASADASADAAVAAASRTALLAMLGALPPAPTPAEATNRANAIVAVNAAFDAAIGPDTDDAEAAGIAAGDAAANAVLSLRYANNGGVWSPTDGSATPNAPAYSLAAGLGIHQPTPAPEFPAVTVPAFTGWPFVRLFALNSASQFRVPPGRIFDISSARYAVEYNQVKRVGDARVRGALPNSRESDIARFWPGGGLEWNTNARLIATGRALDRWQHARLLALLNMSVADSMITNLESKYHYNFWRPVTAIRWADDGNKHTATDPAWRPFLQTPPYPDYPCASTSVTGAATQTLRRFFGSNGLAFTRTVTAPPLPLPAPLTELPAKTITRHYGSMTIAEIEQVHSRVYGGLHFLEGCHAGIESGNQVADWIFARQLRPL